jgi:hypothetical protein
VNKLNTLGGNEQLVAVFDAKDELLALADKWSQASMLIDQRLPEWRRLEIFLRHAGSLPTYETVRTQADAIRKNRSLLDNPNPVAPLLAQLFEGLRVAVGQAYSTFKDTYDRDVGALQKTDDWARLGVDDQERILAQNGLTPIPVPQLGTEEELLSALAEVSLPDWSNRIAAIQARVAKAREEAARLLEPTTVPVHPPAATLRSKSDVEAYVNDLRARLLEQVEKGPVVIL